MANKKILAAAGLILASSLLIQNTLQCPGHDHHHDHHHEHDHTHEHHDHHHDHHEHDHHHHHEVEVTNYLHVLT